MMSSMWKCSCRTSAAASILPKSPGGRTVIQFVFPALAKFAHWWIVLEENGTRELCADNPGKQVDVQLRSDVRTMVEIWAGDMEIGAAKKSGRLQVSGHPALVRNLSSWLRIGLLARFRPHPDSRKTQR